VREYVAHCMKGIFRAAPYPGFNDGSYRARHMPLAADRLIPLVHALRNGGGARPASHDCIVVNGAPAIEAPASSPLRVALHAHLFYPDLTPEFRQLLHKSGIAADLFISCANDAQAREIQYHLHGYKGGRITVRRVPNAGRDIGPFITEFGQDFLAGGYDLLGHLHGKKSKVLGPKAVGDAWRNYLWENLLGGQGVWETVQAAFSVEPRLGLLFAEDRHIIGWTKNRACAEELKQRLGLSCGLPEIPVFPIGTMFWCRPQALAAMLTSGLAWSDYPPEPLPYDSTILHAIERLLPTLCEQSGHVWKTIYLQGSNR
jgi:lipopolysaccharide biosynthesis protein